MPDTMALAATLLFACASSTEGPPPFAPKVAPVTMAPSAPVGVVEEPSEPAEDEEDPLDEEPPEPPAVPEIAVVPPTAGSRAPLLAIGETRLVHGTAVHNLAVCDAQRIVAAEQGWWVREWRFADGAPLRKLGPHAAVPHPANRSRWCRAG